LLFVCAKHGRCHAPSNVSDCREGRPEAELNNPSSENETNRNLLPLRVVFCLANNNAVLSKETNGKTNNQAIVHRKKKKNKQQTTREKKETQKERKNKEQRMRLISHNPGL
jgi:hypothetical protein